MSSRRLTEMDHEAGEFDRNMCEALWVRFKSQSDIPMHSSLKNSLAASTIARWQPRMLSLS